VDIRECLAMGTKYIYLKSTTVDVPSSELGLSQPFSRQRVCPSPQNRGGAHSLAGEGLGEYVGKTEIRWEKRRPTGVNKYIYIIYILYI
jgi:hypothetical protein